MVKKTDATEERILQEGINQTSHPDDNRNTGNGASKNPRREQYFSNYFHRRLFLIALISLVGIGYFWISSEYADFKKEAVTLRNEYIQDQKEEMKSEVNNVHVILSYYNEQTEQRLQHNIKERVYEACAIAENIYQKNKDTTSITEIEKMIKDALRPVRYNNGRGYFFAVSMDGVEKLYPVAPQFEEQNLLDLQDEKGHYVIRDEIVLIKKQGEGFVRDYWRKPDASDEMIYPKISFVKHFPPLNWYFGSGEYLDDVQKDIQEESLKMLSDMRLEGDKYLFVDTYDGDVLISDGTIHTQKQNLWDFLDSKGNPVVQMERHAAKNPEGDFIQYYWKKPGGEVPEKKTSFVRGFDTWQWMIGTGFYENEINAQIDLLRHELAQRVKGNMLKIILILCSLTIIILVIGRLSLRKMNRNIRVFWDFFRTAVGQSSIIPKSNLSFHEFRELADSANYMIHKHNEAMELLQESEEKYRMLAKNLGEGVVIFDNERNFQYANAEAATIFGIQENTFLGRNLKEFLASPEETGEITIHNACGEKRKLLVTSTIRYDKLGNKVGSFEIFRDITETRMLEKERDKNRERMRLLYKIMRHDLANSFAVIRSAVRLYAKDSNQELSTEVLRQVHKGLNIIDMARNMEMTLSKNDTSQPVNLCKLLSQLQMDYSQIPIEVSGSCAFQRDGIFYSVFDNLISNAIIHGKATKISIHLEEDEERSKITFSDDGIGIPDEAKHHVFDEGFIYGESGNTGIGLHIVKKAIERNGGEIYLRDNHPHGTIFEIILKK